MIRTLVRDDPPQRASVMVAAATARTTLDLVLHFPTILILAPDFTVTPGAIVTRLL
jgi:hypothetical protein